jgi:hypothetical protein
LQKSYLPSTLSWILRHYLPEIAEIFRIKPMPRNRAQHQMGLSDDAFERLYPGEGACRKAWFAWRWPEGFKCPRCAATAYCEIREHQLLQCRDCRYQASLIVGTVLQGIKLPMRVHLVAWIRQSPEKTGYFRTVNLYKCLILLDSCQIRATRWRLVTVGREHLGVPGDNLGRRDRGAVDITQVHDMAGFRVTADLGPACSPNSPSDKVSSSSVL